MHPPCDLEVHVNGEHIFHLSKRPLLARCGRLVKAFRKSSSSSSGLMKHNMYNKCYRLILNDLPGGSAAFELVIRFCYRGGDVSITTSNVAMLRCAAEFMEMTEDYAEKNLSKRTESFLAEMALWSFEEIFAVLKSCESLLPLAEYTGILQRCVDTLAIKASFRTDDFSQRSILSPDYRYSIDAKSLEIFSKRNWWSEDLSSLSMHLLERLVKAMVAHNADNKLVAKLLLHYLQDSLPMLSLSIKKTRNADHQTLHKLSPEMQIEVLETVVCMLYKLERASVSCRSLFAIRRMTTGLNVTKNCQEQVEEMIGSQLDKATLDNILIRAGPSSSSVYDVDLILRLVRIFLDNQLVSPCLECLQIAKNSPQSSSQTSSLKTVGNLMDLYLVEIAADLNLKASKFKALAQALPDVARESHDGLFRALDIYLEAHPRLSDIQVQELCIVANFRKLSLEVCMQAAQNPRIPPRLSLRILLVQQERLRIVVENSLAGVGSNNISLRKDSNEEDGADMYQVWQMDYYSMIRQNDQLKSDLQKMQSRVVELENACRQMKSQISKHSSIHD